MARTKGTRRPVDWYATPPSDAPASGAATIADGAKGVYALYGDWTSVDTGRASLEEIGEHTHIRTIGDAFVTTIRTATVQAIGHEYAFGIIRIALEAFIATAVPDPLEQPDADWLFFKFGRTSWRTHSLFNGFTGASYSAWLGGDEDYERFHIDCQAMRKIGKHELLVGVLRNRLTTGSAATGGLSLSMRTRSLLKE